MTILPGFSLLGLYRKKHIVQKMKILEEKNIDFSLNIFSTNQETLCVVLVVI